MTQTITMPVASVIRDAAQPLTGSAHDYNSLLELMGDAQVVLLGEARHGTHEFYRERARITRRLIEEEGFAAVAVEADWPDAYRVNRWVRGASEDRTALDALGSFERFPRWMWRNRDVLEFVSWLQQHNRSRPEDGQVGFYGLDLYSLFARCRRSFASWRRWIPRRPRAPATATAASTPSAKTPKPTATPPSLE